MPELVLDAFESNVSMLSSATLATALIPELSADAVAVLTVNVDLIRSVFTFKTNSDSDLKYYVNTDYWPTLNAANAMMDHVSSVSPIAVVSAANKMMIAHDFTRYLALNLFGTSQGVDLFNNESELLQNLRLICGQDAGHTMGDILSVLTSVNLTGNHAGIVLDASGNYMTNDDSSNQNICRILFEQLIGVAPARFANLVDSPNAQPIPFQADDTISFKLTINASAGQESLTGVSAILPRSYRIKLIMKSAGQVVNTSVDSAEE
jgi:hypothetical protein